MPRHRKGVPTPQLAAEYLAGQTTVELGEKYRMTPTGVWRRLRRAGVTIRPAQRRTVYDAVEVRSKIAEAYKSGLPVCDVASLFGVSRSSVVRALKRGRIKTRPFGLRKQTIRVPTDPEDLGYLRALLDGEGNLQLRSKHAGRSVACKLAIYSTTAGVMDWLSKTVGGHVRWDHKRAERKGWLPIGIWEVYRAQDVAALLKAMLPRLIVKRQAAERALTLFSSRFEIHDSPPVTTQSSAGLAGGR